MYARFLLMVALIFSNLLRAQFNEKFDILNGGWSQSCDSIISGAYKGKVECNPEIWTQAFFLFSKGEGNNSE